MEMDMEMEMEMENLERLDGPLSAYGYKWRRYHAEVYKKPVDGDPGKFVALKMAFYDLAVPDTSRFPLLEVFILGTIRNHPNVISLQKYTKWQGVVKFYFEHMETNLEQFIKHPCSPMSPILRKEYLRQILSGIEHCHYHGVIHRHLEPRFVMISHDKKTVKISEFGEAKTLVSPTKNSRLVDHNDGYRAPEVILGPQFSAAADVWAIGCIFAAMVLHKPLFNVSRGAQPNDELFAIFSLLGKPDPDSWPEMKSYFECVDDFDSCKKKDLWSEPWGCFGIEDTGLDLLYSMLTINPKDRITAADALDHPYFKETADDTKMLGKRKFEEISGDVALAYGEGSSL